MKKFILLLCVCVLCTASAYAASAPIDPSQFGFPEKSVNVAAGETLPSSFDLRNYGVVPPTRNQKALGTCWAFAVMSAIETNYLVQISNDKKLVIPALGEASSDIDLAEIHMTYFICMAKDKKLNFSVESGDVLQKNPTIYQALNRGAAITVPVALMSRGYGWGPVSEKNNDVLSYDKFVSITTDSEDTVLSKISPDTYPTLLTLKEAVYFSTAISQDVMFTENQNALKELLMKNGALAVSYNDSSNPKFESNDAYYYPADTTSKLLDDDKPADETNHLVAIIGWDDNYSKENFNSENRPANNGAWLVRNSWGESNDDGKRNDYLWISYEQVLFNGTVLICESTDKKIRTYQYDDLGWCESWGYGDATAEAANVFEAQSDGEILKEVGFYTTQNDAEVNITVYTYAADPRRNNKLSADIAGGTIRAEKNVICNFAGYHTVSLDSPVTLNEGDIFAVAIEFINPSYNYPLPIEQRMNGYSDFALAFDGESYLYDDGVWLNGASLRNKSGNVYISTPANICIKAFTECTTDVEFAYDDYAGKSINNISVDVPLKNITVDEKYIEDLNPVENENSYKGRKISFIVVSNDGKILPEGTSVAVEMMYIEEFNEKTPGTASKYGLREVPKEIDPLYPAGFTPDVFIYDDYLYPGYICITRTDGSGRITIDADNLTPYKSDRTELEVPAGHYDAIYVPVTKSGDNYVPVAEVAGALRTFEITAAENNNSSGDNSSSNCNAGFTTIALAALAFMLKKLY